MDAYEKIDKLRAVVGAMPGWSIIDQTDIEKVKSIHNGWIPDRVGITIQHEDGSRLEFETGGYHCKERIVVQPPYHQGSGVYEANNFRNKRTFGVNRDATKLGNEIERALHEHALQHSKILNEELAQEKVRSDKYEAAKARLLGMGATVVAHGEHQFRYPIDGEPSVNELRLSSTGDGVTTLSLNWISLDQLEAILKILSKS